MKRRDEDHPGLPLSPGLARELLAMVLDGWVSGGLQEVSLVWAALNTTHGRGGGGGG